MKQKREEKPTAFTKLKAIRCPRSERKRRQQQRIFFSFQANRQRLSVSWVVLVSYIQRVQLAVTVRQTRFQPSCKTCPQRRPLLRAQELFESRGGRPGLPVHNSPNGLCARKATLNSNSAIVARNSSAALELFTANCQHAKCFAVTCRSQYIGTACRQNNNSNNSKS